MLNDQRKKQTPILEERKQRDKVQPKPVNHTHPQKDKKTRKQYSSYRCSHILATDKAIF